ncbi:uromodulin [Sarotherodon galilaeus]
MHFVGAGAWSTGVCRHVSIFHANCRPNKHYTPVTSFTNQSEYTAGGDLMIVAHLTRPCHKADRLSPHACLGEHQGLPRPAKNAQVLGWWDVPRTPHLGGILVRCPNHLIWLLSMWRSSGSTLSPSQMAELPTLSLRERPASLWRKLISTACICDLILSATINSSSLFTTTDQYSVRITAAAAPIHLSISRSLLPSLVNKIVRYLNSSTWGRNSSLTQSEHSTLFRLRIMASDLEVLILTPTASHSTSNRSSASWRPSPDEANRTTSSAKSRF